MLKKLLLGSFLCLLSTAYAFAQTSTISGTITDASTEEPLPQVNVYIVELETGAATDLEGNFEIANVEHGTYTFRISSVGYKTRRETITVNNNNTTFDFSLQTDVRALDDVVVTAFGVEREARSLGYSSQDITSEEINNVKESNFVNSLQGKAAGVEVTSSSGGLGRSSRIILRGVSSLSGDNQPLFIIDGVYVDNSNLGVPGEGAAAGEFANSADYGNAAMDINSNDIASVTVLKGPNAAALYGSKAANGAVIITTKDGSQAAQGLGVTFDSQTTFTDVANLPDMQNQYGQGYNGQFAFVDGRGGGTYDGVDASWGPPLNGQMIPQFPDGQERPWVPNPDNIRNYFNTGVALNNNISLQGNYEDANFRLSMTDLRQDGVFPAEELDRQTVSLNTGVDLSSDLRVNAVANYYRLLGQNRPAVGYGSENPMQQLTQWIGRQVDTEMLKDYQDAQGNPINWNYNYHDNPYWMQEKNGNQQERDRLIGNINARYNLNDWISVTGLVGNDFYSERRQEWNAVNTINDPDGRFYENVRNMNVLTANAIINAERDLSQDFYLDMRLGTEMQKRTLRFNEAEAPGLSVPGVYSIANSSVRQNVDDYKSEKRTNSVFASATLGFRDYLYLDLTGRNDWSSTLPEDNNSYFYPSASLSFIFTDAFDIGGDWFTYGKLRGGWTQVGNDTDPYQLQAAFNSVDPFGDIPSYSLDDVIPNTQLKPESIESVEIGADLRFFDNRLGLDVTYYDQTTTDQILPVQISRASGYVEQIINAGEVRNNGVEVMLSSTPVQTPNLRWDLNINWSKNNNEVIELVEDLDALIHGSTWDTTVESRPGEEFGTLYGTGFLRDDNGNIIVGDDGVPLIDSELRPFGSFQADWKGGISNTITYKGLSLNFLIDMKYGGKLTSTTYMFGRYTGILEETLKGREEGFVFDGGRWAEGAVKQDGSPNDIPVSAQAFNEGTFFGNSESHIFDATYVKLRELRIAYSLPVQWLTDLPFSSVDLGLVGRNLWIIHKEAPHIDPETAFNAGNVQGLESNQFPSVRSVGFNVRFTL